MKAELNQLIEDRRVARWQKIENIIIGSFLILAYGYLIILIVNLWKI